jgi:predicted RNase H-like nuclease (RuvC/YqgF family)
MLRASVVKRKNRITKLRTTIINLEDDIKELEDELDIVVSQNGKLETTVKEIEKKFEKESNENVQKVKEIARLNNESADNKAAIGELAKELQARRILRRVNLS